MSHMRPGAEQTHVPVEIEGTPAEALVAIERKLFAAEPDEAAAHLKPLLSNETPAHIRAQALALRALREAHPASVEALTRAAQTILQAEAVATDDPLAQARIAHARGYVGFKRGEKDTVLHELNRAAALYGSHSARGQVFDTLGMWFRDVIADLDRARSYFLASYRIKEEAAKSEGGHGDWVGLAMTCGNLGELELRCENLYDAERWMRTDLEIVLANNGPAWSEAIARVLLAEALRLQGPATLEAASVEVRIALKIVPPGTWMHAYALNSSARLALSQGNEPLAREHMEEARTVARAGEFADVTCDVRLTEGLLLQRGAGEPADAATIAAERAFEEAHRGFRALHNPRKACEAALAKAALFAKVKQRDNALRYLLTTAVPEAEAHLFGQMYPLAHVEANIAELNPWEALRVKHRRLLGGTSEADLTGRLHGERHRMTIWTCDIRGFTEYCGATEPRRVVEMLNRFFAWVGQPIIDADGCIDKYVGDNILAYFTSAETAVGVALATFDRVRKLNVQREHLDEPELHVGIGIATGDVLIGNVGFVGKLEHTIIGTPVNLACRLVGEANPGEVVVDRATRDAVAGTFECRTREVNLKGLADINQAYLVTGRPPQNIDQSNATMSPPRR